MIILLFFLQAIQSIEKLQKIENEIIFISSKQSFHQKLINVLERSYQQLQEKFDTNPTFYLENEEFQTQFSDIKIMLNYHSEQNQNYDGKISQLNQEYSNLIFKSSYICI